jgi:hypothetical protein
MKTNRKIELAALMIPTHDIHFLWIGLAALILEVIIKLIKK